MKRLITNLEVIPENIYYSFSIKNRLNNLIQKYDKNLYFTCMNYFNGTKICMSFVLNDENDIPENIEEYFQNFLQDSEWVILFSYNNIQNYTSEFLKLILFNIDINNYETKLTDEGLLINLENYRNFLDIYEEISLLINNKLRMFSNYAYNPSIELIKEWRMIPIVTQYNNNTLSKFYKVNINSMLYDNYGTVFDFFEYMKKDLKLYKFKSPINHGIYHHIAEKYNIEIVQKNERDESLILLKESLTFMKYINIMTIINNFTKYPKDIEISENENENETKVSETKVSYLLNGKKVYSKIL